MPLSAPEMLRDAPSRDQDAPSIQVHRSTSTQSLALAVRTGPAGGISAVITEACVRVLS